MDTIYWFIIESLTWPKPFWKPRQNEAVTVGWSLGFPYGNDLRTHLDQICVWPGAMQNNRAPINRQFSENTHIHPQKWRLIILNHTVWWFLIFLILSNQCSKLPAAIWNASCQHYLPTKQTVACCGWATTSEHRIPKISWLTNWS